VPGLEADRVAEILVTPGMDEPARRGSGYRVTAQTVLTSEHVVRGAPKVRVRFDADQAGEWSADVIGVLEVPEIDVALLTITPRGDCEVTPAEFGRISERDAVIGCSAVGFPLWKLREDRGGLFRDSAHVVGGAAMLANRREGTLEITVAPPGCDPDPKVSPWQGMSGAAVFCNGRIVGIIRSHHRSDGLGRLAASRADRWQEQISAAQEHEMESRLGMRPLLRELPDVSPSSPGELVAAAYLAQVRDIAPDELIGREDELAELAAFCARPEAYQWWQGNPWAGKTALAAWFVLHPPAGVRVASFFITSRLGDQSDSAAFTEAMIDQLAVIAGEPPAPGTSAAARDGLRRHLIEAAAERLRERGERLVLVVDGLDEDTGTRPGSGRPSIASLLPRRPPDGVRVLVTSRAQLPLPADVAEDHPLGNCRRRKLAALPFAYDAAAAAWNELQLRLHADGGDRDVIALITAAGGGLTVAELAELTGRTHFEIQARLGTVLGRSLYSRTRYEAEDERGYLFAHETLRAAADKILHADLGRYRDQIHAWASKYRDLGWPETTPFYLLRPYRRLLTALGDTGRLAALAADRVRHDRMLQRTGTDMMALTEIAAVQDLLLAEAIPDLRALVLLAAERHRIAYRTDAIPPQLPAVWARLGRTQHALDLARSITDPGTRAQALAALATELRGDAVRASELAAEAEQAARALACRRNMPMILLDIAMAFVSCDSGHAGRLADEAEAAIDPWPEQGLGADFVTIRVALGEWDVAEEKASRVADLAQRARALAEIASCLADTDPARAERLADAAEDAARRLGRDRLRAFAAIAILLTVTDLARAKRLTDEAERAARACTDPSRRALDLAYVASALAGFDSPRAVSLVGDAERAIKPDGDTGTEVSRARLQQVGPDVTVALALAAAAAGLPDHAEHAAGALADPWGRTRQPGVASVAAALARSHPSHSVRLAEEAERVTRTENYLWQDVRQSTKLVEALVAAGQPDLAEQLAGMIPGVLFVGEGFITLASALAKDGQLDRAQRATRWIEDPENQAAALALVASGLAASQPELAAGLADEARRKAECAGHPGLRARALAEGARALAGSHPWHATEMADEAAGLADSAGLLFTSGELQAPVAAAYAALGHWDRAGLIARDIPDPRYRRQALADTARALAHSQPERAARFYMEAEAVAETIGDSGQRASAQVTVAWAQVSASATSSGARQHMSRLLAQALATDRWPDVLPTLGKVAPEAIPALYDWMLARRAPGNAASTPPSTPRPTLP